MKHTFIIVSILITTGTLAMQQKPTLIEAVKNGDLEAVQQLSRDIRTLNTRDTHGRTPLMFASEMGHVEMVKTLIEAGADIDAKDRYGFTVIDLLESILRRVHFSSPEYLQERAEKLRQEGFSEDDIDNQIRMIKGSAVPGPPKTEDDIRKLNEVLHYLRQIDESRSETPKR